MYRRSFCIAFRQALGGRRLHPRLIHQLVDRLLQRVDLPSHVVDTPDYLVAQPVEPGLLWCRWGLGERGDE